MWCSFVVGYGFFSYFVLVYATQLSSICNVISVSSLFFLSRTDELFFLRLLCVLGKCGLQRNVPDAAGSCPLE